jgi:S1-C subfamily serine protease
VGYYGRSFRLLERLTGKESPRTRSIGTKLAICRAEAAGWVGAKQKGPIIGEVIPDSAAEKWGLVLGDWIVEYGGTRVSSANEFMRLRKSQPTPSTLIIIRDGERRSFPVPSGTLGMRLVDEHEGTQ